MTKKHWDKFFVTIMLPTLLAIVLLIGSVYFIIIPAFQDSFLDSKKEMIKQLTNVAWNILVLYEQKERLGEMERDMAQKMAILEIRNLRYGDENKDYFWITDMHPHMIMHPYSPELDDHDLTTFHDPTGVAIFVEMKNLVAYNDNGYLNYTWHTKYSDRQIVPKLSYVKKFSPWQWIVGTGVFLDDVEKKTSSISKRLFSMVFVMVAFFTILLLFSAHQSFKIEKKRRETEDKLKLSREKYKVLAETTTDPMVMIYDNSLVYANRSMTTMLRYTQEEIRALAPTALFARDRSDKESGLDLFYAAVIGHIPRESDEGVLLGKDGHQIDVELSFSPMSFGDQSAIVMVAKDIRESVQGFGDHADIREKFKSLSDRLRLGIFRVGADKNLPLHHWSETTRELLGLSEQLMPKGLYLLDFFADAIEKEELAKNLAAGDIIKNRSVHFIVDQGRKRVTISLSLVASRNSRGDIKYYDGMIEDITEKTRAEQERENLIVELQTSLLFLNQPIKYSLKNFVTCSLTTSIAAATKMMAQARLSSILVQGDSGEMIGIITDMVLRERVIAENLSYDTPVYRVMSSPLIYIEESALIFEAVLLMQEKGIKHLVVKNSSGKTVSVISNEELLHVHRYSTAFMLSEIREADSLDTIRATHIRVPRIVKSLTDSGAHAKSITRVITKISDTILEKIINLTIDELGEPPQQFCFVSLGSEGRGEQTLVTDQDNALIFADCEGDREEMVRQYFEDFGNKVCTSLNLVGYAFCKGNVMAMNPRWCQPLSQWKEYFSRWIEKGNPQDLLEVSIFFDFRCLYGDESLTTELRRHIARLVESRAPFLQHLAQNSLLFRPPLDFFGNITAETGGDSNSFDIKKVIASIVGFARVYAIHSAIDSPNTLQRMEHLHKNGEINRATFTEIIEAYNHFMQLRFKHQVKMIDGGKDPNNYIDLGELSHMEKILLKKAFSQVTSMQKQLSYTFSGVA